MTPPARLQAAIELLDGIVVAARDGGAAADTLIARYFKTRRYAGSKDRRAVRELVYAAIRRAGERPASGRAAMAGLADDRPELAALFDGSPHGAPALGPKEPRAPAAIAPGWLAGRLADALDADELPALLDRAPLDIRANRLVTTREALRERLAAAGTEAEPTPHAPDGLRLPDGAQVEANPDWAAGQFEVQDEGSQLVTLACRVRPGMTVIDLCAGAGGKTLALGAAMADRGRLIACDTDRGRLARLTPRATRAGLTIATTHLLDPNREAAVLSELIEAADVVLVDAPCSGTGTWRRNPEARWRITPDRLERLIALQARLLDLAATLVKPGGRLVHVVCSLLDEEGAGQATGFLARHPGWSAALAELPVGRKHGPGWLLSPARDRTDGFFFAPFERPC